MSMECSECARDTRAGHEVTCSKAPRCHECKSVVSHKNLSDTEWGRGIWSARCICGKVKIEEES